MKISTPVAAAVALVGAMFVQIALADEAANAEAFKELDSDGNGLVTMQEAEARDDVAGEFADADENGDGMLDMQEFAKMEISDE
jgi:Ca2+-binding EF-hand superfamily protein